MDGFALPLLLFTAFLGWLLVEVIRGSFECPVAQRAGVTWAVTCPVAGMMLGLGLAPVAVIFAVVSALALGSLAYWFLATEPSDGDDGAEEPVEPDPGPNDDVALEVADEDGTDDDIDWSEFDRVRADWEKELAPVQRERELEPAGV